MVELAAVALELGSGIEHLAEDVLDDADVLADGERAAEPVLDVGRDRKVVRVDVGLDNPLDLEARLPISRGRVFKPGTSAMTDGKSSSAFEPSLFVWAMSTIARPWTARSSMPA